MSSNEETSTDVSGTLISEREERSSTEQSSSQSGYLSDEESSVITAESDNDESSIIEESTSIASDTVIEENESSIIESSIIEENESSEVITDSSEHMNEQSQSGSSMKDADEIKHFNIPYFLYMNSNNTLKFYYYIPLDYEYLFESFKFTSSAMNSLNERSEFKPVIAHYKERLDLNDEWLLILFQRLNNRFLVIETADAEQDIEAVFNNVHLHFLTFYNSNPILGISWQSPIYSTPRLGSWHMSSLTYDEKYAILNLASTLELGLANSYHIQSDVSMYIVNTYISLLNIRYTHLYNSIVEALSK